MLVATISNTQLCEKILLEKKTYSTKNMENLGVKYSF